MRAAASSAARRFASAIRSHIVLISAAASPISSCRRRRSGFEKSPAPARRALSRRCASGRPTRRTWRKLTSSTQTTTIATVAPMIARWVVRTNVRSCASGSTCSIAVGCAAVRTATHACCHSWPSASARTRRRTSPASRARTSSAERGARSGASRASDTTRRTPSAPAWRLESSMSSRARASPSRAHTDSTAPSQARPFRRPRCASASESTTSFEICTAA